MAELQQSNSHARPRTFGPGTGPTAAQQKVLDRIAGQRDRVRARRQAHAQSLALAPRAPTEAADDPLALRAVAFAREHPLAMAAIASAALVAGPRRLVRWAGVLLPFLLRLRR